MITRAPRQQHKVNGPLLPLLPTDFCPPAKRQHRLQRCPKAAPWSVMIPRHERRSTQWVAGMTAVTCRDQGLESTSCTVWASLVGGVGKATTLAAPDTAQYRPRPCTNTDREQIDPGVDVGCVAPVAACLPPQHRSESTPAVSFSAEQPLNPQCRRFPCHVFFAGSVFNRHHRACLHAFAATSSAHCETNPMLSRLQ